MAQGGIDAGPGLGGATLDASNWAAAHADAASGAAGVSLDQRPRPAPVWPGFRAVDACRRGGPDRAQVGHQARRDGGGRVARQAGADAAEAAAAAYQRDPEAIEHWRRERFPAIARQARAEGGEVWFW